MSETPIKDTVKEDESSYGNMKKIQVYLPQDLIDEIDSYAKMNALNRGQAIRQMAAYTLRNKNQK